MMKYVSKISFRLPVVLVFATTIAALSVGIFSYFEGAEEVRRQEIAKLVSLGRSRHAALTQYFSSIEEDLDLLATSPVVTAAMTDFRQSFGKIDQANRTAQEELLRRAFNSATQEGDGAVIRQSTDRFLSTYFQLHQQHHSWLNAYREMKGYYDIFLISPIGDIVYTAIKEVDFASNLSTGKWSESGLAKAFDGAVSSNATYADFEPYGPSLNEPAAFIARPILDNGRMIGVLALQMPVARINTVMQVTAGMGDTGETYVVGQDNLMRTDSRFSEQSTILKTRVDTPTVAAALRGESGVDIVYDYRDVEVLSAYQPFQFKDSAWAVMAEIDVSEIERPVAELRQSIAIIVLGLLLLFALSGIFIARSITRPLGQLHNAVQVFRETRQPVDATAFKDASEISTIAFGFSATSREIVEYIEDINEARVELKQIEGDLRAREENIRTLIDVSPIGFVLSRNDGRILISNRAFRKIFGLSDDIDVLPDARRFYANPEDRERFISTLKRDGSVIRFECEMRRDEGKSVWVTLSSRAIDYEDSPAIMSWIDDVSERKAAEHELAEREAILRTSFDTMTDGIYVIDADLRYLFFNDRYVELVDLPQGTIQLGGSADVAIRAHADRGDYGEGERDDLVQSRLTVLGKPGYVESEISINGGVRTLNLRKASLKDGGAVVILSDVTQRIRDQAALAAKELQLRTALENMTDGIMAIDQDLKYTLINDQYRDMLDLPDGIGVVGSSAADTVKFHAERGDFGPGDPEEQIRERLENLRASTHVRSEIHLVEKEAVLGLRKAPLEDGGSVIVMSDITEERKSAQTIADAKEVIDQSIAYASRIQHAILPHDLEFKALLPDSYCLWEPRDTVGGDVYWCRYWGHGVLLALGDCTGHGVPGAFMTLIASGAMDQATRSLEPGDPAMLLQALHSSIQRNVRGGHKAERVSDGLELGVCYIDFESERIIFAGARFSLFAVDGDDVREIKGAKTGVGYADSPVSLSFENTEIPFDSADSYHMISDGVIDQIGGNKRLSFGKRRYKKVLLEHGAEPLEAFAERLKLILETYQGEERRRDDISAVGFRPRS